MRVFQIAVFALTLCIAQTAGAQRVERIGFAPTAQSRARVMPHLAALPGNSGMPRWVRWGLVGAVGGAALFTLVDALNSSSSHLGTDILAGAVTGFVVVGGGVLIYDAACSPGSGSRSGCR